LQSLWLWLVLVILLIPFCTVREKTLLILASLLLLLSPLSSLFERNLLDAGNAHILQKAQVSPYSAEFVDSLRAIETTTDSSAVRYSIGLLEKRGGNFDAAFDAYSDALEENREDGSLYNNLGNVLFSGGNLQGAVEEYEEGIQYTPDLAALHYNLAQASLKLMRFDEYTKEIEIANKLDFELVTEYVNDPSEHSNRLLIDERLPVDYLWNRVFLASGVQTLSPVFENGVTTNVVLGLVLLLSLILIPKIWKTKESYCTVCGAPSCRKCSALINEKRVCNSCTARLKLTKSAGIQERISVRIAERKVRLKKLTAALLSIVPGMGHLFAGCPYKGFILLFVSVCVAFVIVHSGVPYMPDTYAYGLLLLRKVLLVVYLVLVGIAVLDVLKVRLVVRRWH
jgi:tetratricopeptide (TPR) repeat protein